MAETNYSDRTEGFQEKIHLLENACAARDFDLAISLADSIRSTAEAEKQLHGEKPKVHIPAAAFQPAAALPEAWAKWAAGWLYFKPLALHETVGIARRGEPVDLVATFPHEQAIDLGREVRVARVDEESLRLIETPSQVYGEVRTGAERLAHLVFLADVPMHEKSRYLVFYGNPYAERPEYVTDLKVEGENFGLDIGNEHYKARLSRQMGQLERLTFKREHGLELFAGGKGHGEPPTIDWAHDYVSEDGFQKLRIRNWPRCPSYEVVQGPLCVRVRRFGFPYSPLHPLYSPCRMHIDIAYTFYAGLPYFFKDGRMDMVKDFRIAAMRDDEWVFSGYSFTETLWIDSSGKLHEGTVPSGHEKNLWGVGYFHPQSGDAFIALWLQHQAEKFSGIEHGGAPTLHYAGHGHVWSRYPANNAAFQAGASIRQRNAYVMLPYEKDGFSSTIERLRHQLMNPLQLELDAALPSGEVQALGALAGPGETAEAAPLKQAIWQALRLVKDEQLYTIDANVVDLGLIYDVRVRQGAAHILMTMPHRGRPQHNFFVSRGGGRLEDGIRERLLKLPGIQKVVVDLTWNPPWTAARLTGAGRKALGLPD